MVLTPPAPSLPAPAEAKGRDEEGEGADDVDLKEGGEGAGAEDEALELEDEALEGEDVGGAPDDEGEDDDELAGQDLDDEDDEDDDLVENDLPAAPAAAPRRHPLEVMPREELDARLADIGRMKVDQLMETWAATQPVTEERVRVETQLAAARAIGALAAADWRGTLADWTRALARKPTLSPAALLSMPASELLNTASERLGLSPAVAPMIKLLYGNRLIGRDAVAPAELVVALGTTLRPAERWREALGGGAVAASGAVRAKGSSIRLSGPLRRFLDEQPPKHGTLVTAPGAAAPPRAAPVVVVLERLTAAPGSSASGPSDAGSAGLPPEPSPWLAKALAASVGSSVLMVQRPLLSERQLRSAALEAKLRHALAVIPYPWIAELPPEVAAIYLAPTIEIAAATGLPLLELPR